jgi:Rhodopirellula transposase DDE domain
VGVLDVDAIRMRYEAVAGHLEERALRLFAASEARTAGRGGIAAVSRVTGLARSTIGRGLKDLEREAAEWGDSNGARVRLWKVELQKLANQTGLAICIVHHPPGTSKWNRIEHRMFAFISQNWRGKPLISHKVIVQLIAATKTAAGLTILDIDAGSYPKGGKISDAQLAAHHTIRRVPSRLEPHHTPATLCTVRHLFVTSP